MIDNNSDITDNQVPSRSSDSSLNRSSEELRSYGRNHELRPEDLLGSAEAILGEKPNPQTGVKWFARLGTYPIKSAVNDLRIIITKRKHVGPLRLAQAIIHLPMTLGAGIAGGYLSSYWPSMSDSIATAIDSSLGFLGERFVDVASYVANVLIVAAAGAYLGDIILNYLLNKMFTTPHPSLHFTDGQIKRIIELMGDDPDDQVLQQDIKDLISVLRGLYKRNALNYSNFEWQTEGQKYIKAAEQLRLGNLRTLDKRLNETLAGKYRSLAYEEDLEKSKLVHTFASSALGIVDRINARRLAP